MQHRVTIKIHTKETKHTLYCKVSLNVFTGGKCKFQWMALRGLLYFLLVLAASLTVWGSKGLAFLKVGASIVSQCKDTWG